MKLPSTFLIISFLFIHHCFFESMVDADNRRKKPNWRSKKVKAKIYDYDMEIKDQIRRKPPPNVPWPIGPVVLVTGASGGIGSNLVNRLLNDKSVRVIFAVDLKISKELDALKEAKSEACVIDGGCQNIVLTKTMDITEQKDIDAAREWVKDELARLTEVFREGGLLERMTEEMKLNTLINNAGIMATSTDDPGVDPFTPTLDAYMSHYKVNAVGTVLTTSHLREIMPQNGRARIVFISSSVGSIGDFLGIRSHRNVAYGMSKAGMNYYMKVIESEDKWLTMSLCPGWVATDMGNKVKSQNAEIRPTEASEAAKGLIDSIEKMYTETNGTFYSLHGNKYIKF